MRMGAPGIFEILIIAAMGLLLLLLLLGIVFAVVLAGRSKRQPREMNPDLMPCADCGNMISRHAAACPHCGRPVSPTQEGPPEGPTMG